MKDPSAHGGRGLPIVDQLAREWGAESRRDDRPSGSKCAAMPADGVETWRHPGRGFDSGCRNSREGSRADRSSLARPGAAQPVPQLPAPPAIAPCRRRRAGGRLTQRVPDRLIVLHLSSRVRHERSPSREQSHLLWRYRRACSSMWMAKPIAVNIPARVETTKTTSTGSVFPGRALRYTWGAAHHSSTSSQPARVMNSTGVPSGSST
jgi:hypothetical protein